MSLAHLIRGNCEPDMFATATSATAATHAGGVGRGVASAATVAVASSLQGQASAGDTAFASCWWRVHYLNSDSLEVVCCPAATHAEILAWYPVAFAVEPFVSAFLQASNPLNPDEESAVRAWLAQIEETNPSMISEVIKQCNRDVAVRAYFIGRVAAELPKPDLVPDDRRSCKQCANLSLQGRCLVAWRGEIAASRSYEPIRDLARRCEGYAPGPDDSDKRHGRERWPGLIQNGEA